MTSASGAESLGLKSRANQVIHTSPATSQKYRQQLTES